jgi:hypothetical protein
MTSANREDVNERARRLSNIMVMTLSVCLATLDFCCHAQLRLRVRA